jgi:hypothetical protein
MWLSSALVPCGLTLALLHRFLKPPLTGLCNFKMKCTLSMKTPTHNVKGQGHSKNEQSES